MNAWTSATVAHIQRDNSTGLYKVTVQRKEGERIFTVKHVVFATGFAGGSVYMPIYPGMVSVPSSISAPKPHRRLRINSRGR